MASKSSFGCAETDLFCNEETSGLLCFDGSETFDDNSCLINGEKGTSFDKGGSDLEVLTVLPCPSEECIGWMFEREMEHLPRSDYLKRLRSGELDMSLRREALDWMFKACAYHNFGELCLYLATNYLDRFLSVYDLPICSLKRGGKTWVVQLVAVACLSLAAKMDEVNVPSFVDLQAGESKFLFEGKTIRRMENLVLNYLNWSMKPYTPLNFIDYYLRKMNDVQVSEAHLIKRSIQIITSTIKGIDFLEFRPSEIAAAVTIYVSGKIQAMDIDKALSSFIGVDKGRVVKCLELIQDLISISGATSAITSGNVVNGSVSSSMPPSSPNGVLDAACLSYKSDERTVGSCPSSSHTSPDSKRRKLDQTTILGGNP